MKQIISKNSLILTAYVDLDFILIMAEIHIGGSPLMHRRITLLVGWENTNPKSILKNRGSIFAKSQRSLIKYNWILRNQDGLTHLRGRICRSWHFRQGFQHSDERFPQQASWSQIYHADESRNPAGFLRIQFCSGSDFLSFGEIDLE